MICACHKHTVKDIQEFMTEHMLETYGDLKLFDAEFPIGDKCRQCVGNGRNGAPTVQAVIDDMDS